MHRILIVSLAVWLLLTGNLAMAQIGVVISDPEPLNANVATDGSLDRFPAVLADGSGNWVAG